MNYYFNTSVIKSFKSINQWKKTCQEKENLPAKPQNVEKNLNEKRKKN